MFKELLINSLKNLTPEEKINVREILEDVNSKPEKVDEEISETGEKSIEKGEKDMPENKDGKTKEVDTSVVIDEKTENNEVDKGTTDNGGEETKKTEEKVEKTTEETAETTENDVDNSQNPQQAQNVEPNGNGVRIEDLVTKEELTERLAAMEAKLTAVMGENMGLKTKLSEMEDKYENKDFGTMKKQGMMEKDRIAESSFDEYSKQFMS